MTRTVSSWTGLPRPAQETHDVYWRTDIARDLASLHQQFGSTLAFGLGRSYGDVCYAESGHAIGTRSLDRVLHFDRQQGILIAEAGISFSDILQLVLPHGWFLPVTPGTKHVTLGGAIANDVHGKNHHRRGTIGCHVRAFGLVRSDRSPLVCSNLENAELFAATIGGLGLTGIIEWAEIQLLKVTSSDVNKTTQRFSHLQDFFDLSTELDATHEYGVAWLDCQTGGSHLGRGIYTAASHADTGELVHGKGGGPAIPFNTRISFLNKLTVSAFNTLNWHIAPTARKMSVQHYDPFFYPLDGISHWNRLYGSKGFQQFQSVVPTEAAYSAYSEMLKEIAKSGLASALTVMKRCGDVASPGLMSFPMPGVSLAIDFPQSRTLSERLLPTLDKITNEHGGRLYPAKDAHMTGEDFRRAYPAWTTIEQLRDPALNSRFWKRVTT